MFSPDKIRLIGAAVLFFPLLIILVYIRPSISLFDYEHNIVLELLLLLIGLLATVYIIYIESIARKKEIDGEVV